jgi:hypothetical protein
VLTHSAYSTGSCCAITKAGKNQFYFSGTFASAWSHEVLEGIQYNLVQRAILLKFGYPVMKSLTIHAQIGLPTSTKLSNNISDEILGNYGLIYGVSLGYELPEIIDPIELYIAGSFSSSRGILTQMGNNKIDQLFIISEFQLLLLNEIKIIDKFATYSGLRIYSGKNQLRDNRTGIKYFGKQEGNIAPLIGFRFSPTKRLSLVAEGGFGHTNVLSIGSVFSF